MRPKVEIQGELLEQVTWDETLIQRAKDTLNFKKFTTAK